MHKYKKNLTIKYIVILEKFLKEIFLVLASPVNI